MAPKQKEAVDLASFQSTPEELKAARHILSTVDKNTLKSKDNSMRQFMLANDTGDNAAVLKRQVMIVRNT